LVVVTSTYAIIETGGKQYRAEPGQSISVEKISAEEGSTIELDRVLLVSKDAKVTVGQPIVEGAKVIAEVVQQAKSKKLLMLKYKAKIRYQVKHGHRQQLTKLTIKEIVTGGKSSAPQSKGAADGA
jgi:large subunit ribosomal protein L21